MLWSIVGSLIPKVLSGVSEYVERKQQHAISIEAAKVEAKIEQIKQHTKMIADADIESIRAQRYSIKDELMMFCILGPYVGAFIPGLQTYVKQGFEIIATLPTWYQVAMIGIIISTFGLRFMLDKFFSK